MDSRRENKPKSDRTMRAAAATEVTVLSLSSYDFPIQLKYKVTNSNDLGLEINWLVDNLCPGKMAKHPRSKSSGGFST